MKEKNIFFSIMLVGVVLSSFVIGYFIDWEVNYLGPFIIFGVLFIVLKLIITNIDVNSKIRGYLFAGCSFIYFSIYSIISFFGLRGGDVTLAITLPIILLLSGLYSVMYTTSNNKKLLIASNAVLMFAYGASILFIMFGIGLSGYGSL